MQEVLPGSVAIKLPTSRAVGGGATAGCGFLLLPQSPGSAGLEGSSQLPWSGRRFQHLPGVKESHVLEKDESTDPKQASREIW